MMQPLLLPGVCRQQAVSPVSGIVMTVFSPGLHAYCMGSMLRPGNGATNEDHCIVQVSCTVQHSSVQYSALQCNDKDHCAGVLDTEVLAARAHQQRHHLHRYTTAHQSLVKQLPDQPHCRGQQVQLPAQRAVRHLDPADPLHAAAGPGRVPVPSQHGTQDINVSLSSCHR